MGTVKSSEINLQQQQHFEHTLQRIEAELNSTSISNQKRENFQKKYLDFQKKLHEMQSSKSFSKFKELEEELNKFDFDLAVEAIRQAEEELSKGEQGISSFQALENVKNELNSKHIQPNRARHEIKEIMRKH